MIRRPPRPTLLTHSFPTRRSSDLSGVVDVAVDYEVVAVAVAKQYLSYFTEPDLGVWDCADQRWLRRAVPENRLRVYEVRGVIETLFDVGSVLELRRGFGLGIDRKSTRLNSSH